MEDTSSSPMSNNRRCRFTTCLELIGRTWLEVSDSVRSDLRSL